MESSQLKVGRLPVFHVASKEPITTTANNQWNVFHHLGKTAKSCESLKTGLSLKKKENHSNPHHHQLPPKEEVLDMPIWVYLGIIHFPKRLKAIPNHKVWAVSLRVPGTINYLSQELRAET